jgi:hypothetical protein
MTACSAPSVAGIAHKAILIVMTDGMENASQ